GWARGIGMKEVAAINAFATENMSPDLTLYLDIEAKEGLARIQKGKSDRQYDRLDQEELAFHEKVRDAYLLLLKENQERFFDIDANKTLEKVVKVFYAVIMK